MANSELALWRYSLIAPLLHRAPNVSISELGRQLAAEIKYGPDGSPVMLSTDTLLRWFRRYQQDGLDALENRTRSDCGRTRVLDRETVARLLELSDEHPGWTVKALHRKLQRELARPVPVKPVYRLLKGRKRLKKDQTFRRRPVGIPQVLWLADTMHGPAVYGPRRLKRKTFLIVVFDDASRSVMAGQFALRDDITALMPILRDAILARGLPHRLLVDNGPNYKSRILRTACARLGIHLVYASPYRPTSKARLERFFLTTRLQMLPRLPEYPTLDQVHTEWARFLAEYHGTHHSSLSNIVGKPTTPLDFYLRFLPEDVRHLPELAIEDLFLIEATRRVNADATIRLASKFFEVRPQLAGSRILIRFNPNNIHRVLYKPLSEPNAPFEQAFPIQ